MKIIKFLIPTFYTVVFFYLSISFINLEFNFIKWPQDDRTLIAVFAALVIFITLLYNQIRHDRTN